MPEQQHQVPEQQAQVQPVPEQQAQRFQERAQQPLPFCRKQPTTKQRSTRRAEQSVSFIFPFPS